MRNTIGVILAAGKGTRMGNSRPKVLHEVGGKPMLFYSIESLEKIGVEDIYVVVGYKKGEVKSACSDKKVDFVHQENLLGTGDALRSVIENVSIKKGTNIILLYGDFPLIESGQIKAQLNLHESEEASCTIGSSKVGTKRKKFIDYGKVIRDEKGGILEIREKDELDSPDKYNEINLGIYCFKYCEKLREIIDNIKPSKKGEFYLTNTIKIFQQQGMSVISYEYKEPYRFVGVNTQKDVARANEIIRKKRVEELMAQGVTFVTPDNTFIHEKIEVGQDSVIYPNAIIENDVKIGKGCKIGPNCRLRSGTILGNKVKVGNFAEIVRSHIKSNVNIKHFSYIGDAVIEENVNIGAGTVTANYDGENKHTTVIKKDAFIGSGTILVAPVTVGENATTGAGSVIPKGKDVPSGDTVVGVPARRLSK